MVAVDDASPITTQRNSGRCMEQRQTGYGVLISFGERERSGSPWKTARRRNSSMIHRKRPNRPTFQWIATIRRIREGRWVESEFNRRRGIEGHHTTGDQTRNRSQSPLAGVVNLQMLALKPAKTKKDGRGRVGGRAVRRRGSGESSNSDELDGQQRISGGKTGVPATLQPADGGDKKEMRG